MIRDAERPLADGTNPTPTLKRGHTRGGAPAVSVNLNARYAGNPSWTDPKALEAVGFELLTAAGWLYDEQRREREQERLKDVSL